MRNFKVLAMPWEKLCWKIASNWAVFVLENELYTYLFCILLSKWYAKSVVEGIWSVLSYLWAFEHEFSFLVFNWHPHISHFLSLTKYKRYMYSYIPTYLMYIHSRYLSRNESFFTEGKNLLESPIWWPR